MQADGYPDNWELSWPGPYPLGMPIWLDSWGPTPPLVHYGNGTSTPGPLLPIYFIAQSAIDANAGLGPPPPSIDLQALAAAAAAAPVLKRVPDAGVVNVAPPQEIAAGGDMGYSGANTLRVTMGMTPQQYFGTSVQPLAYNQPGGYLNPNAGVPGAATNDLGLSAGVGAAAGALGNAGCDQLPVSFQAACRAAVALGASLIPGGQVAGAAQAAATAYNGPTNCPPGYTMILGRCTALQNALPGGQPMTLTRNQPTTGGMGLSALTPTQVGTIQRKDGTTGPILKCPARYVLGMDFLCYPKSMIPNQLRAHPRGTRPLLTGGEVRVLNRARGLAKKVGKLGHKFGPKTCHCSTKRPGRKK